MMSVKSRQRNTAEEICVASIISTTSDDQQSKKKNELFVHGTPTKEAHPNIQWLNLNHSKTMSVFLSNFHSLSNH